jgi:CheY-like chemotaxis protein
MANVLLIEDDNSLSAAYSIILGSKKHTVETACNGKEALEKLKKVKPEIILLDLLMPVMGGLEFIKKYKPQNHEDVSIILLTNMPSSHEVDQCVKLGVETVVIKSSLTPTALLRLVDKNLKNNTDAA